MKDWKKEFDEKFAATSELNGHAKEHIKTFISKVEADAIARAISDDLQRQLTEERKLDAEQMCMCTPEINRNEAYERAAKVAEKECDCTASWDISCHSTKTAQSIRSLKDET